MQRFRSGDDRQFHLSKVSTCPNCKGSGQIVSNPCSQCRGTGVVKVRENVTVKIPAGAEPDSEVGVVLRQASLRRMSLLIM